MKYVYFQKCQKYITQFTIIIYEYKHCYACYGTMCIERLHDVSSEISDIYIYFVKVGGARAKKIEPYFLGHITIQKSQFRRENKHFQRLKPQMPG